MIPPIGAERKRSGSYDPQQNSHTYDFQRRPQYVVSAPRLPSFSGDKMSEVSYRQWRAEVKGLLADLGLPIQTIINAIRR
jgi:hypothetical protein